jgi:hypothetical protein
MKNFRLWGAIALLAGLGLTSCGADPTNFGTAPADKVSNKITGSVYEWGVDISAGKAEAGEVTFAIANFGSIPHEFIVVKTDFKLGEIPLGDNNRFDEEGQGVEAIDEIAEFEVDTSKALMPVPTKCSAILQAITRTACMRLLWCRREIRKLFRRNNH